VDNYLRSGVRFVYVRATISAGARTRGVAEGGAA
jgi:hypothetical protein